MEFNIFYFYGKLWKFLNNISGATYIFWKRI